jgi:peptidoglycan-associated lipoprotein
MSYRRLILPALVATFFAACSSDPPPPPEPTGPTAAELEQMRQDSIAAAEAEAARLRAEAEAARRAEAEARAAREAAIAAARATLEEAVYFDYDESEIRSDSEAMLRAKVEILRANSSLRIRIEGHADERGSTEYNLALGTRRAEAVRQFFTSFGIDASRFAITSYGEERPAAQGSDEDAWSQNRRAEFVITGGSINPGM